MDKRGKRGSQELNNGRKVRHKSLATQDTIVVGTAIKQGRNFRRFMTALYMDPSCLARKHCSELRRVCIFGFLVETLSPSPLCMRTPIPNCRYGLEGHRAKQV